MGKFGIQKLKAIGASIAKTAKKRLFEKILRRDGIAMAFQKEKPGSVSNLTRLSFKVNVDAKQESALKLLF